MINELLEKYSDKSIYASYIVKLISTFLDFTINKLQRILL